MRLADQRPIPETTLCSDLPPGAAPTRRPSRTDPPLTGCGTPARPSALPIADRDAGPCPRPTSTSPSPRHRPHLAADAQPTVELLVWAALPCESRAERSRRTPAGRRCASAGDVPARGPDPVRPSTSRGPGRTLDKARGASPRAIGQDAQPWSVLPGLLGRRWMLRAGTGQACAQSLGR
jgi:hypothetical protein